MIKNIIMARAQKPQKNKFFSKLVLFFSFLLAVFFTRMAFASSIGKKTDPGSAMVPYGFSHGQAPVAASGAVHRELKQTKITPMRAIRNPITSPVVNFKKSRVSIQTRHRERERLLNVKAAAITRQRIDMEGPENSDRYEKFEQILHNTDFNLISCVDILLKKNVEQSQRLVKLLQEANP